MYIPEGLKKDYYIIVHFLFFILSFFSGCARKEYIITTDPARACVFWDGVMLGSTPLEISTTSMGEKFFRSPGTSFFIEIYKEFYTKKMINIEYAPNKKNIAHVMLAISKEPLPGYDGIFLNRHVLEPGEIDDTDLPGLEYLKSEVYARYGKSFHLQDVSEYFHKKTWYKENPYYDDSFLTQVDKKNIELIDHLIAALAKQTAVSEMIGIGNPSDYDLGIMKTIIENQEYTYDSGEEETTSLEEEKRNSCILVFEDSNTLQWYDDSNYFGTYYDGIDTHLKWNWQVYRSRVYVWDIYDDDSGCILFIFTLDHWKREIIKIPEIDGRIWK